MAMRGEFRRGHIVQTAVGTFLIVFVAPEAQRPQRREEKKISPELTTSRRFCLDLHCVRPINLAEEFGA
jgi:hypothetical protein